MTDYDPDALDEEADGDFDIDYHGVISAIEEQTAEEVFGDAAKNPSRPVIEVLVDTEANDEIREVYSLPDPDKPNRSWANPNFKLRQFRDRYGSVPRVGMEVDITVDDNGFLSVEL